MLAEEESCRLIDLDCWKSYAFLTGGWSCASLGIFVSMDTVFLGRTEAADATVPKG